LATYTNLPKEKYLFKVQASYRANQWADTADTLRIYIEPPLWKTTWFRLVFAVVLLSVISIFVLVLIRRARAEYNLGQATKLNENLVNNLKLLKERNQTLEGELSEKNKKMAAMAISSISFSDKMGKMITNLKALKEKLPADFQSKVDASLRSMNKDFDKIKEDAQFNENFNLLYDDFQKRFATAFPKLTHKDVKICAYIRMSKSNVEIAEFLNISPSSIEISRYRIRKKLELPKGSGLNDFILRF
jgi:hypothetical protein